MLSPKPTGQSFGRKDRSDRATSLDIADETQMGEIKRVLITAKTYPTPSKSYRETVCTGGVLEDGAFIRLYPINFRYRPEWERFEKYQWIEVEVEKNPQDNRPETYKLVKGSKIITLDKIPPKNWAERRKYVLAKGTHDMCDLNSVDQKICSMGIVNPRVVRDVKVEPVDPDWKNSVKERRKQLTLLEETKPLMKIPYKFSYVFECKAPGCKGHKMMDEDWEVGQLFRRMLRKYKSEKKACEKVRAKLLEHIDSAKRDIHFFVGTVYLHNTWVIVGTFCPPKGPREAQTEMNL